MSIILKDVSYVYMAGTPYERVALKDINLTIGPGEFVGIIGHTGSGKSTLVQHMNGLLKPTKGVAEVDGVDLAAKGEAARLARRKVGMVFQYPEHQLFEETVFDDVAFGPRNLGLDAGEVEARVKEALAFVGLDFAAFAKRSPFRLSGGQMRRGNSGRGRPQTRLPCAGRAVGRAGSPRPGRDFRPDRPTAG
jgi:energy-coupling factor transport system ATP-binding protein